MKHFFTLAMLSLLSISMNAQCTPDTSIKTPGIHPSVLPHAIEDSMYSIDLQFKVPSDTVTPFGSLHFDSIALLGIGNMPAFMSYQCHNDSTMSACTWKGGANACVHIGGKPPVGSAGKYKLRVKLRAYYVVLGNPTYSEDSSTTRDFFVDAPTIGVNDAFAAEYHTAAVPNPFDQYTDLPLVAKQAGLVTAQVFDCQGRRVMSVNHNAQPGQNYLRIEGGHLPSGVYHVAVTGGGRHGFVRIVRL